MALNPLQDFYKQTLTTGCSSGVTKIYVSVKPTVTAGYLVISPSNASLREIVRYSSVGTDTIGDFINIALITDRGLGGTTAQAHNSGESVRMNVTSRHWADIIAEFGLKLDGTVLYPDVQAIINYINGVSIAGAPNSSISVKGIGKISVAPLVSTDPIFVGNNDPRVPTINQAQGLSSAFPSQPSLVNSVITKDIIYIDGISTNQLTDNTVVAFGQNDATTRNLKIAQSFIPGKSTIESVIIKKGATTSVPVVITDTTMASFALASGGVTYVDNGVVNSKREIFYPPSSAVAAFHELSKTLTGAGIGDTCTGSFTYDPFNTNGTNSLEIFANNVSIATFAPSFSVGQILNYTFVATVANPVIKVRVNQNQSSGGGTITARHYNFTNTTTTAPAFNINLDIFANDIATGNPTGASLGQIIIPSATWNALAVNTPITGIFAAPITGLDTATSYWLVVTSSVISATLYPSLRKTSTNPYPNGLAKYNNTTDGWIVETGDLYFQINQSVRNSLVATDNTGKIPSQFLNPAAPSISAVTSPSRVLGTTYQNLTGKNIFVMASILATRGTSAAAGNFGRAIAYMDITNNPSTIVGSIDTIQTEAGANNSDYQSETKMMTFVVPANSYYKILSTGQGGGSATLVYWTEQIL